MDTKPSIKSEIERILAKLEKLEIGSEDYDKVLKQLKGLHDLQKRDRVSPDAWVNASASVLGILLVLNHERLNVISSRALMFIKRSS